MRRRRDAVNVTTGNRVEENRSNECKTEPAATSAIVSVTQENANDAQRRCVS